MLGAKPSKEARHDLHLLLRHIGPVHLSRCVDRLQEVVMTRHELKVILAATGLSKTAPVVEVPGHAIVAAMILRRAIRRNSKRVK